MKRKNGFTLVELLAVIVILAIVALVTVPMVMNVIKDAREKSAIESFRGYMDAVEKTVIRDSMKTTSELPSPDTNGCYSLKELDIHVKVKGSRPIIDDEDTLCVEKGQVKSISEVTVSGYKLEYKNGKILVNGKSVETTKPTVTKVNLTENVELGDIIKMTPTSTSYTITSSLTGASSSKTINPSQMKWWRVINKNNDGTIDVISEYLATDTSGNDVGFYGQSGYQKLVGSLNTIASQYTNSKYVQSTRYFGYNGQTATISSSLSTSNSGTASTPELSDSTGQEYNSGLQGDTLYAKDYNLLIASKKAKDSSLTDSQALICYKLDTSGNPTTTTRSYILASRYYYYNPTNSFSKYMWNGRVIHNTSGTADFGLTEFGLYFEYNGSITSGSVSGGLRPILILKANLNAIPSSESGVDYVLE